MSGIIVARPADNDNEIEKPRWVVRPWRDGSWIVEDTWSEGFFRLACYRARLATSDELVHLQEHNGLDAARLAPGCFIYAISRLIRDSPPLELQTLFVVLPPQSDMEKADCMAAWHDAVNIVRRQVQ
jgi:hypothetical protein